MLHRRTWYLQILLALSNTCSVLAHALSAYVKCYYQPVLWETDINSYIYRYNSPFAAATAAAFFITLPLHKRLENSRSNFV